MAKDYAKTKSGKKKSGASRSKKKPPVSIQLIVTALLIMGAMIAFLIYLKTEHTPLKNEKINKTTSPVKVDKKMVTKPILKTRPSENSLNKLEEKPEEIPFYRTHEEMVNKTVEIPIEDLKLPDSGHRYTYTMPCGSFRENRRAEELKAKIAMAGYESKINPIKVKSGLWYRVELGPFKSKRKTESVRHRLQDNGFNYCKIYRKQIN